MMIDDLNLYYGQFHALKDISLNIQEKEITAFIGPSGCGKSTLLKSLNRMNDLVEGCKITGQVTLDETDIYRDLDVEDPDVFSHRAWELKYQREQEIRRNQPARTKKKSYDIAL